jgi:hypothetical protein
VEKPWIEEDNGEVIVCWQRARRKLKVIGRSVGLLNLILEYHIGDANGNTILSRRRRVEP